MICMTSCRKTQLLSPLELETGWCLRNYLICANTAEIVALDGYTEQLICLVKQIENSELSCEFQYFRLGFIVGHFGKRGICISIWHWGKWLTSQELFNQCWYTYGRDLKTLSILDRKEPILCQFEAPILMQELQLFHRVASDGFENRGREAFLRFSPRL